MIDIFNCLWSVNRQLTVNCDCIVLFTVNGDCLSENPVNCDLNITRDTWFSLLSVKYLGVAEIYIPRIAQNVPILMIFSQIFRGACPRTPPPLRLAHLQGLIHHRSLPLQKAMLRSATGLISCTCKFICQSCGVDKRGRSTVNELLNEWKNQGDEDWVTVGPMGGTPLVIRQIKKSNLIISINDLNTIFYLAGTGVPADKSLNNFRGHPHSCANLAFFLSWNSNSFFWQFFKNKLEFRLFQDFPSPVQLSEPPLHSSPRLFAPLSL